MLTTPAYSLPDPNAGSSGPDGAQPNPAPVSDPGPGPLHPATFGSQPVTSGPPSFPQSPGESDRAFEAFRAYLELGPRRRYAAVGRKLGVSLRTVRRWASAFDWRGRIKSCAAQLAEQYREIETTVHRADCLANTTCAKASWLSLPVHTSERDQLWHVGQSRLLSRFVAGSDMFASESNGQSVAKQYRDLGLTLRPAFMDRVSGWSAILQGLGDPAAGIKPTLFFHRRCKHLLESLPYLQHDPDRPGDVLKTNINEEGAGGDDAADALRYLVATKSGYFGPTRLRGL